MIRRKTAYIPMISLTLWTSCIHWAPPEPLLHNTPVERSCNGSTVLTEGTIYLSARDLSSVPLRKGAHTMIDMAYGVDSEGQSYYNDTLISSAQHHQQDLDYGEQLLTRFEHDQRVKQDSSLPITEHLD